METVPCCCYDLFFHHLILEMCQQLCQKFCWTLRTGKTGPVNWKWATLIPELLCTGMSPFRNRLPKFCILFTPNLLCLLRCVNSDYTKLLYILGWQSYSWSSLMEIKLPLIPYGVRGRGFFCLKVVKVGLLFYKKNQDYSEFLLVKQYYTDLNRNSDTSWHANISSPIWQVKIELMLIFLFAQWLPDL